MTKRNQKNVVEQRWEKKAEQGRVISEKHLVERKPVKPLVPMNELQREYINLIQKHNLVITTGLAGTSKTYIPTVMACDMFREGLIETIYITRPNISNSKSLGFFGGSLVEKMSNWLMPVLSVMTERLGWATLELAIKRGQIVFVPMEVIKGMSFGEKSFTICDESEDLTIDEAKKLTTRQGGGYMVLCGDVTQSELKERSGLAKLVEMIHRSPELSSTVGLIDFNRPSDIVRSDDCRRWVLAWRDEK